MSPTGSTKRGQITGTLPERRELLRALRAGDLDEHHGLHRPDVVELVVAHLERLGALRARPGSADLSTSTTFRTNYSGKVVATLFGDRGTVMRCRFRLVNPSGGMQDGGTGECQLSTGGKLDAQF